MAQSRQLMGVFDPLMGYICSEVTPGGALNEVEWASRVCERLNRALAARWGKHLRAEPRKRVPYRNEIFSYRGRTPEEIWPTQYQTDLVIIELRATDIWIPRVIIEGKLTVSAHDALTYDAKASAHKNVHPYLRYGILVGGLPAIPLRLFRHGINFDFMIGWANRNASRSEWSKTVAILKDEVEASRSIESMLRTRKRGTRFSTIHRRLVFK